MLIPGKTTLQMVRGATFDGTLLFYTDEAKLVPWNFTGYKVEMFIHESPTLNEAKGIEVEPTEGSVTFNMSATETVSVKSGRHFYITFTNTSTEEVLIPLSGEIEVSNP